MGFVFFIVKNVSKKYSYRPLFTLKRLLEVTSFRMHTLTLVSMREKGIVMPR